MTLGFKSLLKYQIINKENNYILKAFQNRLFMECYYQNHSLIYAYIGRFGTPMVNIFPTSKIFKILKLNPMFAFNNSKILELYPLSLKFHLLKKILKFQLYFFWLNSHDFKKSSNYRIKYVVKILLVLKNFSYTNL